MADVLSSHRGSLGMPGWYVLNENREPVPEPDMLKASEFFSSKDRIVAQHTVNEVAFVSTVFLGLDHNHGMLGDPLLFETLVQGGAMDDHMERYSTWREAKEGHFRILEEVCQKEKCWEAKWVDPSHDIRGKTLWQRLLDEPG